MTVDVCPSPALYPYYEKEGDIVIVADISGIDTICAKLQNGASA
jgi:2-phosphosulfolactate phosphatase